MVSVESTIYHALLIGCAILAAIIAYFVFSVYRYQRNNIALQRRYFLNEIGILEKERARIARDLHDSVGTTLTVMQFTLSNINGNTPKEIEAIEKTNTQLNDLLIHLGHITRNLTPKRLEQKGLLFVLDELKENIQDATKIKCEFKYKLSTALHPSIAIHLYRIIQEIINNSIKHANPTLLTVKLKQHKNKLYILCEDNGKGFDFQTMLNSQKGLGLSSIHSRIEMLGATFQCTSNHNGTSYFLQVPLNP
jgi:signal transduction histidine kinase